MRITPLITSTLFALIFVLISQRASAQQGPVSPASSPQTVQQPPAAPASGRQTAQACQWSCWSCSTGMCCGLQCGVDISVDDLRRTLEEYRKTLEALEQRQGPQLQGMQDADPQGLFRKHRYCVTVPYPDMPRTSCQECWSYLGGEGGRVDCAARIGGNAHFGRCSEPRNRHRCPAN